MSSCASASRYLVVCLCLAGSSSLALPACSSSGGGGGGANGGAAPSAGASGGVSLAGSSGLGAGTSGAAAGSLGAAGTSGAAGAAGVGAGGSSSAGAAGVGGTASAGAAGNGAAGAATAGAAGGAGAAANCAGNAISLSANGTGSASDAADAHVSIDLANDLPIGNAPRTVEFWAYIQPTDWLGEKNEIYVYGGPGSTNTAFGLDFGTNPVSGMPNNHATLNPYTNGSYTVDSTNDLGITSTAAQWVHVAMSWDGTSVKTYVNGALEITMAGGSTPLATISSPLTMGCNPPINNCFNGKFDELRVWSVARSALDVQAAFNKSLVGNEPGLVGYWKFDEAPGATSAKDSVTSAGHTAHSGELLAASDAQKPTFVTPSPPAPVLCP